MVCHHDAVAFNLDIRHDTYRRFGLRWSFANDFWRGGVFVLRPDHPIGHMRWAVPDGSDGRRNDPLSSDGGTSPELSGSMTAFSWRSGPCYSYLWKQDCETREEFGQRSERQAHLPVFQHFVNTFVSGILRVPPDRGTDAPGEPWTSFWEDVDTVGTDIDAFIRRALALAITFGRIHAVVDRSSFDVPALTLAEQQARGERTYAYLVSPLDLVDWLTDERGRFIWAVLREDEPIPREPGVEPDAQRSQYKIWRRDRWELWRHTDSADRFSLFDSGPNPTGEVPIVTLWATRDNQVADMACESPLADVLDFDRHLLNKFSELDESERTGSFAVLWFPEMDGVASGPVDLSPFRAFTGNAAAGAPQYIAPPDELPTGKLKRIQDELYTIRQLASVGRGKAEYSKEERSAEAIGAESKAESNQMATWSAATEEFDIALHRLVALWEGKGSDDHPQVGYPRQFDMRAVSARIQEITTLSTTKGVPPLAVAALLKPLLSKLLAEYGISSDVIGKVETAVDDQVAKVEEQAEQATKIRALPQPGTNFPAKEDDGDPD